MEQMQGGKRKRVYPFEPNAILCASFSQNYLNYLLPALLKISCNRSNDENQSQEIEKVVRFQVDMALVLSTDGFRWSDALKRKLQSSMSVKSTSLSFLLAYECKPHCRITENLKDFSPLSPLPRPLTPMGPHKKPNLRLNYRNSTKRSKTTMEKKERLQGKDDELVCRRFNTLRRILPGGDEMATSELLSEVESYVICLELQVSILKTLVNAK